MTSLVDVLRNDRGGLRRTAFAVLANVTMWTVAHVVAWLAALSHGHPGPGRGRHDGW